MVSRARAALKAASALKKAAAGRERRSTLGRGDVELLDLREVQGGVGVEELALVDDGHPHVAQVLTRHELQVLERLDADQQKLLQPTHLARIHLQ